MDQRIDGRTLRYANRREELLAAATTHVLEHGMDDLTLRSIAATAGVSHGTLVHHFQTRDRLVAEIVDRVLARMFSAPTLTDGDDDPLRAIWAHSTAPAGRRYIRLFIAITGQAMYPRPPFADAVERSIRHRITLIADALEHAGRSREQSVAMATVVLSAMRGLMIDLLVTGDEDRIDAAFEWLLADLQAA
jgi:AcrR family transcriptional regulator